MGVIIAVIIGPNGAWIVVIRERYPQPGAKSSRLTVTSAGNPAGVNGVIARTWAATAGCAARQAGHCGPGAGTLSQYPSTTGRVAGMSAISSAASMATPGGLVDSPPSTSTPGRAALACAAAAWTKVV